MRFVLLEYSAPSATVLMVDCATAESLLGALKHSSAPTMTVAKPLRTLIPSAYQPVTSPCTNPRPKLNHASDNHDHSLHCLLSGIWL